MKRVNQSINPKGEPFSCLQREARTPYNIRLTWYCRVSATVWVCRHVTTRRVRVCAMLGTAWGSGTMLGVVVWRMNFWMLSSENNAAGNFGFSGMNACIFVSTHRIRAWTVESLQIRNVMSFSGFWAQVASPNFHPTNTVWYRPHQIIPIVRNMIILRSYHNLSFFSFFFFFPHN